MSGTNRILSTATLVVLLVTGSRAEDLAKEYEGRLKVGAVDIDKAQNVAKKFGIMSVPTIIFFKGGEAVDKITGLQPKANLKKRIDAVIG